MNDADRAALAHMLRSRRENLGISARELARRAGVDQALLTKLDQCKIAHPRFETMQALARELEIPLADLYVASSWLPEGALPSLRPYMRAKYEDMPEEALAEVEQMVDEISRRYGLGPHDREDE